MKINLKNIILPFFILLSIPSHSKVIYVNDNIVGGNNDGTSWQDAYANFQDAITEAIYGDSIWVAEGIYFPTANTNQDISFELKNGVKWFGGFQGNETELSQRDYELYPTILNGDIGVQGDSLDNSYHVIYTISSDTTTILDGFLIKHGRAIDPITPVGSPRNFGGGLLIDAMENDSIAEPKIINCTFQNNMALYGGGISFGKGFTTYNIKPLIENCNFINNKAVQQGGSGGAISIIGGNDIEATIFIRDCLFENNQSFFKGGAIYLSETTSDFKFINCDFIGNFTFGTDGLGNLNGSGGGLSYYVNFFSNLSQFDFIECRFFDNYSRSGGAISFVITNNFAQDNLKLTFKKNSFINNNSDGSTNTGTGASVIDYFTLVNYQNITFEESDFINNESINGKPIIRIESKPVTGIENDSCSIKITDCNFIENGARCFYFIESGFSPVNYFFTITNNFFKRNYESLWFARSNVSSLNARMSNCTFFQNDGFLITGNIDENNTINVSNSIFWEDLLLGEIFNGNVEGFNIHHSLLKSPDCLINGIDYCGDGMLYNLYPEFRDTMNNDFSLRSCSPAINQGENISIDSLGIFFDIAGNPRILDDAVDLGAYETQAFEVLVPQAQNVKCHDGTDGAITWVQHGTPPFSFEWDNGVTTGTAFTELSAGNYSIAVMDGDNCLDTFNMTVNQPLPLEIMDTITAATGAMIADGMIEVLPTGGVPDYQYLWSNGDTTALVENLLPGTYTVTVTDANGCEEIVEMEVGFMTAINELDKKYSVRLIPNLLEQGVTSYLVFDLEKNAQFEIEIFNEIGQFLFSKKIEMSAGKNTYELPVMREQGLFFVKIKTDDGHGKILKWIVF